MSGPVVKLCPQTNEELRQAARLFAQHGRAYRKDVERIEELLYRREAMGYDPQPAPDPEADAERERRRKRASEYIEKLNKAPEEELP